MANKKFLVGILAMVLVFGIAVIGCDNGTINGNGVTNGNDTTNGNGSENGGVARLARMNIIGATNLFIAPASANRLFKVTEDGFVEEVTYFDDEGNPITLVSPPTSIIVLNDDFLIVSFGSNNYLVNTNTGAAFIFTNDLPNPQQNRHMYGGEFIGHDNAGNIYFISSPFGAQGPLRRLSVRNVTDVSIETVSAPNDTVFSFGVDLEGNVAYEGSDAAGNRVLRFRTNNGGFDVLPGQTNHSNTTFWTGFDGKLYYLNASNPGSIIKILTANPFTVTDFGTNEWQNYDSGFNFGIGIQGLLRINNQRRIIAFNQTGVLEVFNEQTNNARGIPISTLGLASIRLGIASDNYYYLAGTSTGMPRSVLVRVNPLNHSSTTLIDGGFDIHAMTVGSDEVITFNALRMSDGAIVIGQVSYSGIVEILNETFTSFVTVLERIR